MKRPRRGRADLGHDRETRRVGVQGLGDDLIGDVRPIEVAGVDVIDAAGDRLAQYGDGLGSVLWRTEYAWAGKLHGAIAHAVDSAIAEAKGAGSLRVVIANFRGWWFRAYGPDPQPIIPYNRDGPCGNANDGDKPQRSLFLRRSRPGGVRDAARASGASARSSASPSDGSRPDRVRLLNRTTRSLRRLRPENVSSSGSPRRSPRSRPRSTSSTRSATARRDAEAQRALSRRPHRLADHRRPLSRRLPGHPARSHCRGQLRRCVRRRRRRGRAIRRAARTGHGRRANRSAYPALRGRRIAPLPCGQRTAEHPRELLAHRCLRVRFASGAKPVWESSATASW